MIAREMFAELGYEFYDHHCLVIPQSPGVMIPQDAPYIEYYQVDIDDNVEIIKFYPQGKFITVDASFRTAGGQHKMTAPLNMAELKAIMKQCEELGWLREEE